MAFSKRFSHSESAVLIGLYELVQRGWLEPNIFNFRTMELEKPFHSGQIDMGMTHTRRVQVRGVTMFVTARDKPGDMTKAGNELLSWSPESAQITIRGQVYRLYRRTDPLVHWITHLN